MTDLQPASADDRPLLVRGFELEATEGDGRTVDLRLMPYNTPAYVADPPDFKPYWESFLPGAFQAQTRAANRVWLNFEHEQGLRGIVGHGVELVDGEHDFRGSFRVHENNDGDKALQMVREGLLPGVSIEFAALRSRKADGVVQRIKARLDKVSLCRFPAYKDAEVLAVRTEDDEDDVEEPVVVPEAAMAEDLRARLEALGIVPVLFRAVVRKPWSGDPSRFTDEQYQRSCLIDRGGDAPPKERCSLPVLEPNGDLNANALGAAAAALRGARGGVANVPAAAKAAAARKLARYYRQAGMTPPPGITQMAG